MQPRKIAIYGAGGFAKEVAWLAQSCGTRSNKYEVLCFIDDDETAHGTTVNDIPVMSLRAVYQKFPDTKIIGGIGEPKVRQTLMEKSAAAGFGFETLIHPRVERSEWIEIGLGTVICAGNILTTNIKLGMHVQINLDCTIGHDVIMGDYTTLAPGVHVSGWVHFGKRVYVGTGAVIINGTQGEPILIEDDVVIGAGACVAQSISAGLTVVGVPARPIKKKKGP